MRALFATAVVVAALVGGGAIARGDSVSYDLWIQNTPPAIIEAGERAGVWVDHMLEGPPTPYLRGDLDGDDKVDDVILVKRRSDGAQSLIVLWGKRKAKPAWLALTQAPSGDSGFWYVQPRSWELPAGTDGTSAPKTQGEVIVMTDPDPKVVYWTGKKLVAYAIDVADPIGDGKDKPWAQ